MVTGQLLHFMLKYRYVFHSLLTRSVEILPEATFKKVVSQRTITIHALKEIDAIASAICRNEDQVVSTLNYILNGDLDF